MKSTMLLNPVIFSPAKQELFPPFSACRKPCHDHILTEGAGILFQNTRQIRPIPFRNLTVRPVMKLSELLNRDKPVLLPGAFDAVKHTSH